MNEETKVKLRQITEMISIYQSSISDDIDMENMKLIQVDLNNKMQQLEDIKSQLEKERDKLYDSGADEIEVIPIKNEIQEIDNSLENISDLLFMNTSIFQMKNIEKEEKVQSLVDEDDKKIDDNIDEGEFEVETILATSEVNEEYEENENKKNIDTKDQESEIIETVIQTPVIDDIVEMTEEEIEPISQDDEEIEIIDITSEEPITELFVNEFQDENFESISQNYEANEISTMMIHLREATGNYKKESEPVVDNRKKTVKTLGQAIEKANRASELVMINIQKTLVGDKIEGTEITLKQKDKSIEKVSDYYRDEDEKIR